MFALDPVIKIALVYIILLATMIWGIHGLLTTKNRPLMQSFVMWNQAVVGGIGIIAVTFALIFGRIRF